MEPFSIPEYLYQRFGIQFHQQQIEALEHVQGPVLLLAVPGAGKTTVMVARIANMIINAHIPPRNILTITFSKAGALEMENRYRYLFGELQCGEPSFCTIHSFCYRILHSYCRLTGGDMPELLEGKTGPKGRRAILREIYSELNHDFLSEDIEEELVSALSLIKNNMMRKEEAAQLETDIERLWDIYEKYNAVKRSNGLMDFDDMLSYALTALNKYPVLLEQWRKRYTYLCVDEAQDTSKLQHAVIRLAAAPHNNLFMVGDEDQSIYRFRGASPETLLSFSALYPGARILKMEENFRSTKSIVDRAAKFIVQNKNRYEKNMYTQNPQGTPIETPMLHDSTEQYQLVARICRQEQGTTAVIYRNNFSAIPLVDVLERENVRFFIRDHKTSLRNQYVVGDLLSFFDLSFDESNLDAFSRIFHKTGAYIKRNQLYVMNTSPLQTGETWFDRILETNEDQSNAGRARYIASLIRSLKTMRPSKALDTILGPIGYMDFLEYTCGTSFSIQAQKISAVQYLAKKVNTVEELLNRIDEMDEIISRHSEQKDSSITLTTAHASKGLEFDTVMIIDAAEDVFPGHTAVEQEKRGRTEDMEEEARLFYVAVTRAKKRLIIPQSGYSGDTQIFPSRFISRLTDDPLPTGKDGKVSVYPGMYILHTVFGTGQVMSINRQRNTFTAFFGEHGSRTLTLDILTSGKVKFLKDKTGGR